MMTSRLATQALERGKSVRSLVLEQQLLSSDEAEFLLDPQRMLRPYFIHA